MNHFFLITAYFIFAFWLSFSSALADPKSELVEKYYRSLQRNDGTGNQFVWQRFREEVPASDWDEIFACMLERGAQDSENGNAVSSILPGLAREGHRWKWSAHLEHAVLAQAKHKDADVRGVLARTLASYDRIKYRSLILSYLDDPDPHVQHLVVTTVVEWPDAKNILGSYVQRHTIADPNNPADPVVHAKQILGNLP